MLNVTHISGNLRNSCETGASRSEEVAQGGPVGPTSSLRKALALGNELKPSGFSPSGPLSLPS
jgi:hypothetical protein